MELVWITSCFVAGYIIIARLYSLLRKESLPSQNKAVLITGCDTGFGHHLALRLSSLGYRVFAGCLLPEGDGAKVLKSTPGVEIVELDVTNEEHISSAVKIVSKKLGNHVLWAIVNNAGIAQAGEFEWCPMETLIKVFDVNTLGLIRITKAFLPLVMQSKGRIINVTSITGNRRLPGLIGYAMSKAAASSFSNGLRLELKKWNIQVIEIAPYFYRTPLVNEEKLSEMLKQSWDRSEAEITEALGTKYFEKYTRFVHRFLKILCISRRDEVVECMVHAITSVSPKLHYKPGNLINVILVDIAEYFPSYVKDYIQCLFIPKLRAKKAV